MDWTGGDPRTQDPIIQLVGILAMSNEVDEADDAFQRRIKLNEMQAAIQAAKDLIEAYAEGLMFWCAP